MAKKKKTETKEVKKVKILKPVSCRFGLACSVGDVIELEVKQMESLVDNDYAEWS